MLIGGDDLVEPDLNSRLKLLLAPAHYRVVKTPVYPSPLDVGQVLHDTEERYQLLIRSPSGLSIVKSLQIAKNSTSEVVEPLDEKYLLVGTASGEADILGCHELTVLTEEQRVHGRVS